MRIITCAATVVACLAFAAGAGAIDSTWNATPNDVNNLLKSMKDKIDVNYVMEVKTLEQVDDDPEKNPILFASGHYNFEYTPREREKLRKYLLDGGMIVFNVGLGSMPYYRSAKRELERMFPERPLQRLSSDHAIFHSYYDLDRVNYCPGVFKAGYRGNEPWFDGITINCRTLAVISRWGMSVGWEGEVEDEYQAYKPESAQRLGVNLTSYASANRAWVKNAVNAMQFVTKEACSTDKMAMVQVVYDGEWKTRHAGLSILLQTFNSKTGIPVKFGLKEMKLSNPKVFDAPLLYITGHENFRLKKSEMAQLRQYLLSGGFLFAEACCGRKGFDLAFRQQMRLILAQHPLKKIPAGSPLFRVPNVIKTVGVTPSLTAQLGTATPAPTLMGMEIEGHYGVIYSPYGLAGGWEMSQSPYAHGYNDVGALKLGQNILMYAVTQ